MLQSSLGGKLKQNISTLRKKRYQINNLALHLKELEKEQSKPKVSRKKGKHIHKHTSVHVYICTYIENTAERQHGGPVRASC